MIKARIRLKALSLSLLYVVLVSFGKITQEQKDKAGNFDLKLYSWDEFLLLVGLLGAIVTVMSSSFFRVSRRNSLHLLELFLDVSLPSFCRS